MKNVINNAGNQVKETGRTMYLAGLGIAATVTDQYSKVFHQLVDKGRDVSEKKETQSENKGSEFILTAKGREISQLVGDRVQDGITKTLGRLGIPSQREIKDLTRSIEQLTEKVQGLNKEAA